MNWLERLSLANREEEIAEIQRVLGSKLNIHKRDKIVVGRVGTIIEKVLADSPDERRLWVEPEPEENDPSHSGIYGLRVGDDLMYGELIAEVCQASFAARSK